MRLGDFSTSSPPAEYLQVPRAFFDRALADAVAARGVKIFTAA
jgi:hypothetical protein